MSRTCRHNSESVQPRVHAMIAPVVDAAWTAAHREELVLADVRWYLDGRPGRAEYDRGHIPGAVFVELDDWLAAPASPRQGRHPLPDPEVFARGMAELGIGDDDTVVAYDDQGGVVAARLVWMLRVTGHEAALLDGGIVAWEGPLETAAPHVSPGVYTPRPWPVAALARADDAADTTNAVIDARQRERYLGEGVDPVDPRTGHIPGARSLPAREHVAPDGRLLDLEAPPQLVEVHQPAVGADVLAGGEAACAGDVPRPRVHRIDPLAQVALALAPVEHDVAGIRGVLGLRERLRGPRAGGEDRAARPRRPGLQRAVPGLDAAVEQRGLAARHAQHPHQPRGHHAALVVVGDHGVVVADAELRHAAGEHLRLGQRVAARLRARRGGEAVLEFDEHRPGDVPGLVLRPARAAVEVPAHVGEHELVAVLGGPGGVDERGDHGRAG